MLSSTYILYIILGVIVMTTAISVIFNFLGVEFSSYGNYLLWFIALAIFYIVLPSNNDNIFT